MRPRPHRPSLFSPTHTGSAKFGFPLRSTALFHALAHTGTLWRLQALGTPIFQPMKLTDDHVLTPNVTHFSTGTRRLRFE